MGREMRETSTQHVVKAKHTAGPWKVETGWAYPCIGADTFFGSIAEVKEQTCARFGTPEHRVFLAEMEANACLIAAAPDLLEALKYTRAFVAAAAGASHFMDGFEIGEDGLPQSKKRVTAEDDVLRFVDAAIAKAEGQQ
jgi:hypothetical protein